MRDTRHPSPEPDLHFSMYPALPLSVLEVAHIGEFSSVEQMMTLETKHQRFPVPRRHHLLPELFSLYDILHFSNVVNLKRTTFCSAILASFGVQASYQL